MKISIFLLRLIRHQFYSSVQSFYVTCCPLDSDDWEEKGQLVSANGQHMGILSEHVVLSVSFLDVEAEYTVAYSSPKFIENSYQQDRPTYPKVYLLETLVEAEVTNVQALLM